MENLYSELDEVIKTIMESKEYKNCIEYKAKMDDNPQVCELVDKIKTLQKKYVKSNYDENIGNELEELNKELLEIPIYSMYNDNLEKVNDMINYVKDTLNDYFYKLFNE